jgi:hypothetical protein
MKSGAMIGQIPGGRSIRLFGVGVPSAVFFGFFVPGDRELRENHEDHRRGETQQQPGWDAVLREKIEQADGKIRFHITEYGNSTTNDAPRK